MSYRLFARTPAQKRLREAQERLNGSNNPPSVGILARASIDPVRGSSSFARALLAPPIDLPKLIEQEKEDRRG